MSETIVTIPGGDRAELRLIRYADAEAANGKAFEEWQVWSGGVDVARLTAEQISAAAQVAQERKAGE